MHWDFGKIASSIVFAQDFMAHRQCFGGCFIIVGDLGRGKKGTSSCSHVLTIASHVIEHSSEFNCILVQAP